MTDEPLTKENAKDEIARVPVIVKEIANNQEDKEIWASPTCEPPREMIHDSTYRKLPDGTMGFSFSQLHVAAPCVYTSWTSVRHERIRSKGDLAHPYCLVLQRRGYCFFDYEYYVVYDPAGPGYYGTKSYSSEVAREQYIQYCMLEPDDIDRLGLITVKTWEEHMKDEVDKARKRIQENFTSRHISQDYTIEMDEFIGPAL